MRLKSSSWFPDPSLLIFLVKFCFHGVLSRPEDGEVRLIGGSTEYEGNVQIYHDHKWGSVCDDGWDIRDATVVCRQLGYTRSDFGTTNSRFGLGGRQIWLSNVQCWGYERNLTTCRSDGWGNSDCDTNEAAGVICKRPTNGRTSSVNTRTLTVPSQDSPNNRRIRFDRAYNNRTVSSILLHDRPRNATTGASTTSTTTTTVRPTPMLINDDIANFVLHNEAYLENDKRRHMQIRLAGGRDQKEGRVEVKFGSHDEWGVICGNGWSLKESDVICRQLGLGQASRAIQNVIFPGPTRAISLSGVTCTGQESHLMECFHKQVGVAECHGQRESIAGVMCNTQLPDLVVDMEFLVSSVYLQEQPMFYLTCAMEENCLSSTAYQLDPKAFSFPWTTRRLLRFTLATKNIGKADFLSFIPKHMWQWHACHKHYHSMEVFAHFDILDDRGTKVAEGHKASFCLEDNACDEPWQKKYNCANFGDQGISVGCFDIYKHDVDCQWIDLTDVKPGTYTFKVTVNPDTKVAEMRYDNNVVLCKLHYSTTTAYFDECKLAGRDTGIVRAG
ncbi:hypothetical protein RvY_15774 [Ramazzottius varieornatus]|uniref:protein-lysine 6-oxidase n=1 Tax=Ramazzottius varieornatus TaxID=947166 RepID=A0A1D1VX81_RAMVA|nr:hypothetical protein RvY_15774 [Ramazzottius varieornatus]